LDGITTGKQIDFEINGKTLVGKIYAISPIESSSNGNYRGLTFGRAEITNS